MLAVVDEAIRAAALAASVNGGPAAGVAAAAFDAAGAVAGSGFLAIADSGRTAGAGAARDSVADMLAEAWP